MSTKYAVLLFIVITGTTMREAIACHATIEFWESSERTVFRHVAVANPQPGLQCKFKYVFYDMANTQLKIHWSYTLKMHSEEPCDGKITINFSGGQKTNFPGEGDYYVCRENTDCFTELTITHLQWQHEGTYTIEAYENEDGLAFTGKFVLNFGVRPTLHCCAGNACWKDTFDKIPRQCPEPFYNPDLGFSKKLQTKLRFSRAIRGGEDASPDSHPWLVSVGVSISASKYIGRCGGVYLPTLDGLWVLTASHCITSLKKYNVTGITATFGAHSNSSRADGTATEVKVDNYFLAEDSISLQPKNDITGYISDIALLKLESRPSGPRISPICLMGGTIDTPDIFPEDTRMWIMGWGYVDNETFPEVVQQVELLTHRPQSLKISPLICVSCNEGRSRCGESGDSGGPVIRAVPYHDGHVMVLQGIVSFRTCNPRAENFERVVTLCIVQGQAVHSNTTDCDSKYTCMENIYHAPKLEWINKTINANNGGRLII